VKKQVMLLIAVLLAAVFLSACGCPVNLTVPDEAEESIIPAPEQPVPMRTYPPGATSENFAAGDASAFHVWALI
jgi:hypothetical protein